MDSLAGQLLIAAPTLVEPNFRRTVVLVAAHGEEGALGLVLNRPSEASVADMIEELDGVAGADARLHVGGPVAPRQVMVLGEFDDPSVIGVRILGDLGLPAGTVAVSQVAAVTRRARVFAGHAGWGPGQLEAELDEESWIIEGLRPEDPFDEHPESLWTTLLERKGGRFRLVARMPLDPSLN